MAFQILQGDVREQLQNIEEKSIQTCVTSPPYWGLRDYGAEGQLGLEPTPEEYVANMVEVFREVKRVLRDDGTVWLNLGDSYASNSDRASLRLGGHDKSCSCSYCTLPSNGLKTSVPVGMKQKDLVGIPWLVAFALRADGWYLRSDIIWHKPNPMPESVTDRPTKSHEYIFLLSKSQKYFYDAEAVKEPAQPHKGKVLDNRESGTGLARGLNGQADRQGNFMAVGDGRNKRSVWTVSTQPYPGAHFATFPPKLIEPCILAGTSPKACEVCGSPWERVVEKDRQPSRPAIQSKTYDKTPMEYGNRDPQRHETTTTTTGWQPTCTCDNKGTGKCKVLDPFCGSGTTLWVAETNGRDSVGIELNPEYIELIKKRMDNMQMSLFMAGVI